jgi:hypothetical protein
MGCFTTQDRHGYSFNRKSNIPKEKNIGFGSRWKWQGLGMVLGLASHLGEGSKVISPGFKTTKPQKNKSRPKLKRKRNGQNPGCYNLRCLRFRSGCVKIYFRLLWSVYISHLCPIR